MVLIPNSCFSAVATSASTQSGYQTAKPTASVVTVNGDSVAFDAYNINASNYFKLRDLAYALNGTSKQFEVNWDAENKAIKITSGKSYTVVGGEMEKGGGSSKTAAQSLTAIYVNGAPFYLNAYTIDGNNYLKLRDVAAVLNFGVAYDSSKKVIRIDTSAGYIAVAGTVASTGDAELDRAIRYGLVPEEIKYDFNKAITFRQFCAMLKNMITLYDASLVPAWQTADKEAAGRNDSMTREEGANVIAHAAVVMGIQKDSGGDYYNWGLTDEEIESILNELTWRDNVFSNYDDRLFEGNCNYVWGGAKYCLKRYSHVSNKPILEYDFKNRSMHLAKAFTRGDAIRSVLRLFESEDLNNAFWSQKISDSTYEVLKENEPASAAQLRENILNAKTEITKNSTFTQGKTYTGTAYYVSNGGSDQNDGLTPRTAWATLDKVNNARLKPGDAVLFRRGDVWYGGLTDCNNGITYSAYGEGDKPMLNGTDPGLSEVSNWSVYGKTPDGGTIWVYSKSISDVAALLFDGTEEVGLKICADWGDSGYIDTSGKPFDVKKALTSDLSFFSQADLSNYEIGANLGDDTHPGPLYLRCDRGNPAEVFETIEAAPSLMGITCGYCNITIDNLCLKNFGSLGVSCGHGYMEDSNDKLPEMVPSVTVQNCEISFCGGGISVYDDNGNGTASPGFSGGAIQMSGSGSKALNNYIHDVDSKVFVLACHALQAEGTSYSDETISGNLLMNCSCALHLADYTFSYTDNTDSFPYENIIFENNSVLYTGYGWFTGWERSHDNPYNRYCLDIEGGASKDDSITIRNNLFYGAEGGLLYSPSARDLYGYVQHNLEISEQDIKKPVFSGNTYVQSGLLAYRANEFYTASGQAYEDYYVHTVLGDKTGVNAGTFLTENAGRK